MPSTLDDLDLKLPPDVRPRLAALSAWRDSLDSTAQAYARAVQQAVSPLLGAVAQLDETSRLLCQKVLAGRAAPMPDLRDRFLQALADQIRQLNEARDFARFASRVAQRELPEAALLEEEAEALQGKLK